MSIDLTQVIVLLQQIKGLVGSTLQGVNALVQGEGLPTIDFAVDMFDRSDQPVLDGYWDSSASNWTIRSNKLIPQGVGTSLSNININAASNNLQPQNGTGNSSFVTENISMLGLLTGIVTAGLNTQTLYLGTFSTPDLNIKITFDVPGEPVVSEYSNLPVAQDGRVHIRARQYVSGNYGVCFGDVANRRLGVNSAFARPTQTVIDAVSGSFNGTAVGASSPGQPPPADVFTPDVSVTQPGITYTLPCNAGLASIHFSDFASFLHGITVLPSAFAITVPSLFPTYGATVAYPFFSGGQNTYYTAAGSTNSTANYNSNVPAPITLTGNTLLLQAVGNVYTVYLNGVQIYTETGAYMTRSRVGISQIMQSMLTNLVANGISLAGITSFKAWPVAQAEPGNQTGRGTVTSLAGRVYNDKYHTTLSNGTVVYNPLA